MQNIGSYEVIQIDSIHKRQFLFESSGIRTITRAIDYTWIMEIDAKPVFNLAFGDYDDITGIILDHVNSNNGDVYKVFNTVLYTIPLFFQTNSNAMVFVRGSDYKRTEIYCKYINKHFNILSQKYVFFGGIIERTKTIFTSYVNGKKYDCLLIHIKI